MISIKANREAVFSKFSKYCASLLKVIDRIVIDSESIVKYASMVYPDRTEMNPDAAEALSKEKRRFKLDHTNPEIKPVYEENLEFAKRMRQMSDEQIAEELTLRMLDVSHSDSLTQLLNEEGLLLELQSSMEVAKTLNIPLTLLYMDADNFKNVNDRFGHAVGDEVIKATADGIRKGTRRWSDREARLVSEGINENSEQQDPTARPHGDEFAVILIGTDFEGAGIVEKNIQDEINKSIAEKVPQVGRLTVTIGKALYDPSIDTSPKLLLNRADLDMYKNKHNQTRRS